MGSFKRTLELSPKRRALLDALRQEMGVDVSPQQRLPRREELNSFPLSFAQRRFWFLHQLAPNSPFLNVAVVVQLSGWLSVVALEQSLNETLRRHEVLRATFTTLNGEPLQNVSPNLIIKLAVIDLRTLSRPEQEAEVQRLASAEARQPFDLAQGPLLRATLLQLGDQKHMMLLIIQFDQSCLTDNPA
jgi:hypothetical protein